MILLQVKPLKELTFTSENITATMTSRQFQVMLDVLTNLLFARLPKYVDEYMSIAISFSAMLLNHLVSFFSIHYHTRVT